MTNLYPTRLELPVVGSAEKMVQKWFASRPDLFHQKTSKVKVFFLVLLLILGIASSIYVYSDPASAVDLVPRGRRDGYVKLFVLVAPALGVLLGIIGLFRWRKSWNANAGGAMSNSGFYQLPIQYASEEFLQSFQQFQNDPKGFAAYIKALPNQQGNPVRLQVYDAKSRSIIVVLLLIRADLSNPKKDKYSLEFEPVVWQGNDLFDVHKVLTN